LLPSLISRRAERCDLEESQIETVKGSLFVEPILAQKSQLDVFQKRQEKSTTILIFVVLTFCISHIFRLFFRIFQLTYTEQSLLLTYQLCLARGRYQVPVVLFIMADLHFFFLTINSSVNFLIYCCVSKEFRLQMMKILRKS